MNSRILLILKYLWEQTDETHMASIVDLMNHLAENGVSADRKTISKNIDMLIEFGVEFP